METSSLEKRISEKQWRQELRRKAMIERDYIRLQQYYLRLKKILLSVLIITIIIFLLVAAVVPVAIRFQSIIENGEHCLGTHFQGSNYFNPRCFTCQQGYNLSNGVCSNIN